MPSWTAAADRPIDICFSKFSLRQLAYACTGLRLGPPSTGSNRVGSTFRFRLAILHSKGIGSSTETTEKSTQSCASIEVSLLLRAKEVACVWFSKKNFQTIESRWTAVATMHSISDAPAGCKKKKERKKERKNSATSCMYLIQFHFSLFSFLCRHCESPFPTFSFLFLCFSFDAFSLFENMCRSL